MPFDPNAAAATDSGIFGLPYTENESALVYVPVPWEATTSYGGGTAFGPSAILEASKQVDLFDLDVELYLKDHEIRDFAHEHRAISHAQIELIAGRASALNRCYY